MKKEFNVKEHEGKNLRGKSITEKQLENNFKDIIKIFMKIQERIVD